MDPKPEYLQFGAGDSLFDAVALSWLTLAFYYSDGFFGRVVYGAQTRIMDGTLGRANCLLITTLWSAFKFVFVPLSAQLAFHFPPETFAPLFAFIWPSYLAADACSEIVGSLFGKQKLRVWGMGEVNRKSVEGTVAGFLASLTVCLAVVVARDLPLTWVFLAVVISLSNTTPRAVLSSRDGRLHDGHRERASVLGLRRPRLLRRSRGTANQGRRRPRRPQAAQRVQAHFADRMRSIERMEVHDQASAGEEIAQGESTLEGEQRVAPAVSLDDAETGTPGSAARPFLVAGERPREHAQGLRRLLEAKRGVRGQHRTLREDPRARRGRAALLIRAPPDPGAR